MERLDEKRIELLRGWGGRLADDARDDLRAAGRAILLLIEEVERLHGDLGNERSIRGAATPLMAEASVIEADVQSGLRRRLAQLAGRRTDDVSGPEPAEIAPPESSSS